MLSRVSRLCVINANAGVTGLTLVSVKVRLL